MVTERELNEMAGELVETLERLLEVVEVRDQRGKSAGNAPPRPLCTLTKLDFFTDDAGRDISPGVGRVPSDRRRLASRLRLCAVCAVCDECLERSEGNYWGIWGGKLPYERKGL